MQKVEGSSPFIRFTGAPQRGASSFSLLSRTATWRSGNAAVCKTAMNRFDSGGRLSGRWPRPPVD